MTSTYILPIHVILPRKTKEDKKFMLNLNVYKVTHYHVLNQAKKLFQPLIDPEMKSAKVIRISYTMVRKDRRHPDTMNVVCIVDKFFLDWLVNNRRIPDDSCLNVSYGGIKYEYRKDAPEHHVVAEIEVVE